MVIDAMRRVKALAGGVLKMAGDALEGDHENVVTKATPESPTAVENDFIAQVDASIAGMKDTAKWTVGVFAALAAILIAGTQLSSLGKLQGPSWMEADRLLIALGAGLAALIMIGVVIRSALSVLAASPKSLDALAREEASGRGMLKDVAFVHRSNLLEPGESIQSLTIRRPG